MTKRVHPTTSPRLSIILGLPFHNVTTIEAVSECINAIENPDPSYFLGGNIDLIFECYKDAELKSILFFAERVFCRSKRLLKLSTKFRAPLPGKVDYKVLLPNLLKQCENKEHSVYLLGDSKVKLQKLIPYIKQQYPKLNIAGYEPTPKGEVFHWPNDSILKKLNVLKPDLLLVALPRVSRERWIFAHHKQSKVPLTFGIGSNFDCIYGNHPSHIGSFWNLLTTPCAEIWQNLRDTAFLSSQINIQRKALDQLKTELVKNPTEPTLASGQYHRLIWKGFADKQKINSLPMPPDYDRNIVCECTEVDFIDSRGLGLLAEISRNSNQSGRFFCLYKPSEAIRTALSSMRLETQIPSVWSQHDLEDEIKEHDEALVLSKPSPDAQFYIVKPLVDLKTKSLKKIEKSIYDALPSLDRETKVIINLEHINFIDSMAIGHILSIKKRLIEFHTEMTLSNVHGMPLKTLQMLKLSDILIEPESLEIVED